MVAYGPPLPPFDFPGHKGLAGGGMFRYTGRKPYRVEHKGKLYSLHSYSFFDDEDVLESAKKKLSQSGREARVFSVGSDSVRAAEGKKPDDDFWSMSVYGVFVYERDIRRGLLKSARKSVRKSKRAGKVETQVRGIRQ